MVLWWVCVLVAVSGIKLSGGAHHKGEWIASERMTFLSEGLVSLLPVGQLQGA